MFQDISGIPKYIRRRRMAHDTGRSRFIPDFSADDLQQGIEIITNGIWIPKAGIQLCRMSRLSIFDTGPRGELGSVIPFALSYTTASFVPASSDSKINDDRASARLSGGEPFCFTAKADADTLELMTHNALVRLSKRMNAGYAAPFFYRRKVLSLLRKSSIESLRTPGSFDKKSGYGIATHPLASECAVISPNDAVDKTEAQIYISYTRNGDAAIHMPEKTYALNLQPFTLAETLTQIINSKNEETLDQFAGEIIEILPELFNQSWSSRKIRHIVEGILLEHLDEKEIPASASLQKSIDHLSSLEKIIVVEKILKGYLNITLYFKISFKQ
jgi:hypothetical protein